MNLKEKLSSKYLTTKDYFDLGGEFFKQYFKEEKKQLLIAFLFFNILFSFYFFDKNKESVTLLFAVISELISLIFISKKTIQKIEKEKCNNIFKIFLRVTNLVLMIIFITVIVNIIGIGLFMTLVPDFSTLGSIILIILYVATVYLILTILYFLIIPYFSEMYVYRNISFIEALKYTRHISKGNKWRKIKIEFIFFVLTIIMNIITSVNSILLNNPIITIVFSNIAFILTIYHVMVNIILYLNVEYMDLKKLNKNNNENIIIDVTENVENNFLLRKTTKDDIEKVIQIIEDAKKQIKALGIDQWQNGYPNREVIENDIKDEKSFVLEKDGNILGTVVVAFEKENSYENITEGQWLTDGYYFVIHRLAVDTNYKNNGIATKILELIEEKIKNTSIKSIKVDTHEGNIPMRKFLEKNEFIQCGVIYLENCQENDSKRIAYEKIIN